MTMRPLIELMALTRPRLSRTFGDENAMEVIGAVVNAVTQIGLTCNYEPREIREAMETVRGEMMEDDYDHLLEVARKYVRFAKRRGGVT